MDRSKVRGVGRLRPRSPVDETAILPPASYLVFGRERVAASAASAAAAGKAEAAGAVAVEERLPAPPPLPNEPTTSKRRHFGRQSAHGETTTFELRPKRCGDSKQFPQDLRSC